MIRRRDGVIECIAIAEDNDVMSIANKKHG